MCAGSLAAATAAGNRQRTGGNSTACRGFRHLYRLGDILWGLMAACRDIGVDEEVAIELMEAHSPSRSCGWDVEQVARSGGEQIGAGTLFFHAKQYGWSRYDR